MSERQTKMRALHERGMRGEKLTPQQAKRAYQYWLSTRPKCVQRMARKFPPGCTFVLDEDGTRRFLVGYQEPDHLIVSTINPQVDYAGAYASRELICATAPVPIARTNQWPTTPS